MKKILVLAIALMLLTGAAFAADGPVSVTVEAGTLAIAIDGAFAIADQTVTGSEYDVLTTDITIPNFVMTDPTGSGLGWIVSFECDKLVPAGGSGADARKEIPFYYTGTARTLNAFPASGSVEEAIGDLSTLTVAEFALDTATQVIGVHNVDHGMGKYQTAANGARPAAIVPGDFRMHILADQYAETYTSTFYATIAQGTI